MAAGSSGALTAGAHPTQVREGGREGDFCGYFTGRCYEAEICAILYTCTPLEIIVLLHGILFLMK